MRQPWLVVTLVVSGCFMVEPHKDPAPSSPSTTGLAGQKIPAGFDFAASHTVRLAITSPAPGVRVKNPTGDLLYAGPTPSEPLALRVPKAEKTLTVELLGGAGEAHHEVTIEGDTASLEATP